MRTKTLLLAAATLAASLAVSSAQVYSQNVVGYYQVNLPAGFNMLGVQLAPGPNGTGNTVQNVFGTNVPSGTTVYAFTGGGFANPATYSTKGGWAGDTNSANAALTPGKGVFVSVPSAVTLTVVGEVSQGNLSNPYAAGYNMIASQVPQGGLVQADLAYTPTSGDTVYRYDANIQNYINPASTYSTKGGWGGAGQPNVTVGEAFWLNSPAGGTWTRTFNVQ